MINMTPPVLGLQSCCFTKVTSLVHNPIYIGIKSIVYQEWLIFIMMFIYLS